MKIKNFRFSSTLIFLVSICLALPLIYSGIVPDSVSAEIRYPNVVKPLLEFGSFGTSLSKFNEPMSADFDSENRLFVLESNNNRIQCFSSKGESLFSFGKIGVGPGEMISPSCLYIKDNLVYVCDVGNNRIQIFDIKGQFRKSFGTYGVNNGQFKTPYGIFVSRDKIYVADQSNNRIQVFDKNFNFLFSIGKHGKGNAEFIHPTDVVVSNDGTIFVCDSKNNRIQKFDAKGKFIKSWGGFGSYGGLMATPMDIEIFNNELLVADLINHRFQAFDLDGKYIYQWGRHPTTAHEGNGRTHYPLSLTVSDDGELVAICEPVENRIQLFRKSDIDKSKPVDDLAWWDKKARFHYGSGASSGGTALLISEPDTHMILVFDISDGAHPRLLTKFGGYGSSQGEINMPSGVAYDPAKQLIYVSDKGNNRIQGFAFNQSLAEENKEENFANYQANSAAVTFKFSIGSELSLHDQGFNEPSGLALAPNGNLYAVDNQNHQVKVFDPSYKLIRTFGGYGTQKGQLKQPISIFYKSGKNGRDIIYVMEQHNYRIQAFDTLGNSLFMFGSPGDQNGQFALPFGLTVGRDGSVYVTDEGDHSVKKFTADGKFIKKWGSWGAEAGMFYKPKGITQGPDGLLYVIDFGNHRGQIFDEDGKFINFFGLGELQNGIFKTDPNEKATKGEPAKEASRTNLWIYISAALLLILLLVLFLRRK